MDRKLGQDGVQGHDTGAENDDLRAHVHKQIRLVDILTADSGGLFHVIAATLTDNPGQVGR